VKVQAGLPGRAAEAPVRASPVACPRCDGVVERIPRLGIDRLLSFFVPLRRYRCANLACNWEGTLRAPHNEAQRYGHGGRRTYL
jgi:hypothetical protein